jgi:hypothetical protein
MARKVSFSALESRSARLRLKIRRRPYSGPSLARGISPMYRRNKTNGTWVLKVSDGHGAYWTKGFALADDFEDTDGRNVLTFYDAQDAAKKLARGGGHLSHQLYPNRARTRLPEQIGIRKGGRQRSLFERPTRFEDRPAQGATNSTTQREVIFHLKFVETCPWHSFLCDATQPLASSCTNGRLCRKKAGVTVHTKVSVNRSDRPSREEVEAAFRTIIRWSGDDPDRPGLQETPFRATRAFEEYFAGYSQDPIKILSKTFEETGGYEEMVVLHGIPFDSHRPLRRRPT